MPIEILPENYPDWIQFDSTDGIGFLTEDPLWQAKVGNADPENAILYRGGVGFLDISSDGGKTWAPIVLPDTIPWFEPEQQGQYDPELYEPIPQPDPDIQKPRPNFITYHSYAGNPAHTGEHAVLCSYNVADGVTTGVDLNAMWIVYTFDDWQIIRWTQVLNDMELTYAPLTEGSYVEWHNVNNVWYNAGPIAAKLGTDDKFAAFHYYTTFSGPTDYVRASKLSASGIILTVDGFVDEATSYINLYPYVWGDKVYFGRITTHTDGGGKERARASVDEWDFSAATPVFNGTTNSADIADGFDVAGIDIFATSRTFMLTDGGRLAFVVSIRDTASPAICKTYLMYYDVVADLFSTPYLYKSGTDAQGIPFQVWLSGLSVAGGDDAVVFEYYELSGDMHYLSSYFMNVGGWYIYDTLELFHGYHASWHYNVLERCCVKIEYNKIVFNARNFGTRILKYDPAYLRFVELYEQPSGDLGLSLYEAYAVRDDDSFLSNRSFWSSLNLDNREVVAYSDHGLFPHKVERWSDYLTNDTNHGGVYCGFGDGVNYLRIYKVGISGNNFSFRAVAVTVGAKGADLIYPRHFIGHMGWTYDGEILHIPTADLNADLTTYDTWVDEMLRHPRETQAGGYLMVGYIGYDTEFFYGWRATDYDVGISAADMNNRVPTLNYLPYSAETDGIIEWGLLYPNLQPTNPNQIYIWSTATGWDYVGFGTAVIDPVRAVVYYGERIYAAVKTSTGIELWRSSLPPWGGGNDMSFLSDCPLDDCGFAAMDVDIRDGTMVLANKVADLLMVFASPPPYTVWYNLTLSHRNDRGVTGLVVL